jgi:hypothetical protein
MTTPTYWLLTDVGRQNVRATRWEASLTQAQAEEWLIIQAVTRCFSKLQDLPRRPRPIERLAALVLVRLAAMGSATGVRESGRTASAADAATDPKQKEASAILSRRDRTQVMDKNTFPTNLGLATPIVHRHFYRRPTGRCLYLWSPRTVREKKRDWIVKLVGSTAGTGRCQNCDSDEPDSHSNIQGTDQHASFRRNRTQRVDSEPDQVVI